jgi:hypothetical protein
MRFVGIKSKHGQRINKCKYGGREYHLVSNVLENGSPAHWPLSLFQTRVGLPLTELTRSSSRPSQHILASWSPYNLTGGDDSNVTSPVVALAALTRKAKSKARGKILSTTTKRNWQRVSQLNHKLPAK